jgi:hypothetical protein
VGPRTQEEWVVLNGTHQPVISVDDVIYYAHLISPIEPCAPPIISSFICFHKMALFHTVRIRGLSGDHESNHYRNWTEYLRSEEHSSQSRVRELSSMLTQQTVARRYANIACTVTGSKHSELWERFRPECQVRLLNCSARCSQREDKTPSIDMTQNHDASELECLCSMIEQFICKRLQSLSNVVTLIPLYSISTANLTPLFSIRSDPDADLLHTEWP